MFALPAETDIPRSSRPKPAPQRKTSGKQKTMTPKKPIALSKRTPLPRAPTWLKHYKAAVASDTPDPVVQPETEFVEAAAPSVELSGVASDTPDPVVQPETEFVEAAAPSVELSGVASDTPDLGVQPETVTESDSPSGRTQ